MGLLQTFSPICGLSFHSLNSIFCRLEVLLLMKSHQFFSFMSCVFGVVPKNRLSIPTSPRFSPRSFIVLRFKLKSVIHLELSFVKSVRPLSRFIVFHVCVSCLNTVKKTVLFLLDCQRSVGYIHVSLSLGFLFC